MKIASLMLVLTLGQSSAPYVRSRVQTDVPNDTQAQCLFWTVPNIVWHQSSAGNQQTKPSGSEFEAVRRSFQSWQSVFSGCGNITFEEGGVVDDRKVGYERRGTNRNLVLFRSRRCANEVPTDAKCWADRTCNNAYDCWDDDDRTIAVTLTTYDENSGIIYDSDIELNAYGFFFTTANSGGPCSPPVVTSGCVSTDVQNTMTHEIGHFVGLDHTSALGSTMNPSAPPGEISKRIIDPGSRDFVCTVYPKDRPSQSCVQPVTKDTLGRKGSTPGCASTGAEAWLPALAGWVLWLARRRGGGRA